MSKSPLFGILKHRIIFLENVSISELGSEEWQEKCQTFADVKPLFDSKVGSLESFDFGHVVTEGYFMFKIRALNEINSKMRISFKGRLFEIKRVVDALEEGRMLQIIALEI
ncbi:MAG: head-tail adaptor protein [Pseudomonadota bacterium]